MQGAIASHNVDGDLTPRVDACTPGHRFATHGLSACLIDTGILGNHSLTFFLSGPNLAVTSTTATRTLVVHPACSSSEHVCADHSCSSSGFCFGSQTAARADNAPPQLQFNAGEQSTVYIPHGTSYSFCNTTLDLSDPQAAGSTPAGRLCESGPVAFDEEDGILSHRVLACPPAHCLLLGCPGHELRTKGLAGCGVDTEEAPIGTSFNVSFTVFDSSRPAASASIIRTVTVVYPCPTSEIYCPDRAVQCAETPCSLRDEAVEPAAEYRPPELAVTLSTVPRDSVQLVQAPGTIRSLTSWAVCGRSPPVDL